MLIVIEGLDGSGKSTQVAKIKNYLASKCNGRVKYLHFPRFDAPVIGDMISGFLRGDFGSITSVHPKIVAYLFAQDRRDASDMMKRWLDDGEVVLLDRYVYSNIAFQCAKLSRNEQANELAEWIRKSEYEIFDIPRPDINIFLDVPVSFVDSRLSEHRGGDDREYLKGKNDIHEADMDFQRKVREVYLDCCASDSSFIRVDCSDSKGNMMPAQDIFEKIRTVIEGVWAL